MILIIVCWVQRRYLINYLFLFWWGRGLEGEKKFRWYITYCYYKITNISKTKKKSFKNFKFWKLGGVQMRMIKFTEQYLFFNNMNERFAREKIEASRKNNSSRNLANLIVSFLAKNQPLSRQNLKFLSRCSAMAIDSKNPDCMYAIFCIYCKLVHGSS